MQRFLDEEIFFLGDYHCIKTINYLTSDLGLTSCCEGCSAYFYENCLLNCPILDMEDFALIRKDYFKK